MPFTCVVSDCKTLHTNACSKKIDANVSLGPTWPVPDVTNVLEDAIARNAKMEGKRVDPLKEIERLKDQSRYVLEVY